GGGLYSSYVVGNVAITDPLFYGNSANTNGGALAINRLSGSFSAQVSEFPGSTNHPFYIADNNPPALLGRDQRHRILPGDSFGQIAELLSYEVPLTSVDNIYPKLSMFDFPVYTGMLGQ